MKVTAVFMIVVILVFTGLAVEPAVCATVSEQDPGIDHDSVVDDTGASGSPDENQPGSVGVVIESPTGSVTNAGTSTEATRKLIESFTSQPVSNTEGIPDASGRCPLDIELQGDGFLLRELSRDVASLMSDYQLSDKQLKSVRERCGIRDGQSIINLVKSDNDLICGIAKQNTFRMPSGDLIFVLPNKKYNLNERVHFILNDKNITLCGIADLIKADAGLNPEAIAVENGEPDASVSAEAEYLINGRSVDIPPQEQMTRLDMHSAPGKSGAGIYYDVFGQLTVVGMNINAFDAVSELPLITSAKDSRCMPGRSDIILKKSYIQAGRQIVVSVYDDDSLSISNSVIKSGARRTIISAIFYKSLIIENSVIGYLADLDDGHQENFNSAISIGSPCWPLIHHRIKNIKIFAKGVDSYTGLRLIGLYAEPKLVALNDLLIEDVEFSEGVTLPVSTWIQHNGIKYESYIGVRDGSTGNTWSYPVGEFAGTGCHGGVKRGIIEFQDGIRCNSTAGVFESVSLEPTVSTATLTRHSELTDHVSQSGSGALSANTFIPMTGYSLMLLPLVFAAH